MHHFCNRNVPVCTFLLQNGALWDTYLMHCGDLWEGSILRQAIIQRSDANELTHQIWANWASDCTWDTVHDHYNLLQYTMIFHTSLQWLKQNIYQSLNLLKTSGLHGRAVGCLLWGFWNETDCIITALHCILINIAAIGSVFSGLALNW